MVSAADKINEMCIRDSVSIVEYYYIPLMHFLLIYTCTICSVDSIHPAGIAAVSVGDGSAVVMKYKYKTYVVGCGGWRLYHCSFTIDVRL